MKTPDEIGREVTEAFAAHAEKYAWGCDHVHYKRLDCVLAQMVTDAVRADREAQREAILAAIEARALEYERQADAMTDPNLSREKWDKTGVANGCRRAARAVREMKP